MIDREHEQTHRAIEEWVLACIDAHRGHIGIDDRWSIKVKVLCGRGEPRGIVEWIPDCYEATIGIRCDLSLDQIRWETIHELYELAKYRSGTIVDQFVRAIKGCGMAEVADLFVSQYRLARNQEIEEDIGRYLQERRPS